MAVTGHPLYPRTGRTGEEKAWLGGHSFYKSTLGHNNQPWSH